jgi:hypothetical protein
MPRLSTMNWFGVKIQRVEKNPDPLSAGVLSAGDRAGGSVILNYMVRTI